MISTTNNQNDSATLFRMDSNFNYIWHYSKLDYRFLEPHEMEDGTIVVAGQTGVPKYGTVIRLFSNGTLYKEEIANNANFYESGFNDIAFDIERNAVAAGYIDYFDSPARDDFYYVKYNDIGIPYSITENCTPPSIQSVTADVVGVNKSVNLGAEAVEYLKYSDVIGYNWYFEDGNQKFGQYLNYNFDESVYPTSFWCMVVATDGIGCTDTMTIDAYTGDVIFPNPEWPPNSIEEKISNSNSIQKPTIYPNPFTNEIRLKLNSSNVESYSVYVYNVLGKRIYSSIELNNETTINLKTYPKGTYIIKLKTEDFIYTERVVKE